jgi:hypothetical protein
MRRRTGVATLVVVLCIGLTSCFRFARDEPDPADIETTLLLIGDAGEPDPRTVGVPLDSLRLHAAAAPERTIILFLGDNVYPEGIPEEGRAERADAVRRLESQIGAVPPGARAIFIPGNHDWAYSGPFGLFAVRQQEGLIRTLARGRDIVMLPGDGCPGPVTIASGRMRLILLDTQWWLHDFIVRDSTSRCREGIAGVTAELRRQVGASQAGQVTLVAAHHPLMTGGEHGGYCGVTGPIHRFGNRSQDIMSSRNRRMRDSLEAAFSVQPPLAYIAGHEHNLQVLRGGRSVRYMLVSGAGSLSRLACAVRLRESYFVMQRRVGFMRLDILRQKGVLLRVYAYGRGDTGGLRYAKWLEVR